MVLGFGLGGGGGGGERGKIHDGMGDTHVNYSVTFLSSFTLSGPAPWRKKEGKLTQRTENKMERSLCLFHQPILR